MLYLETLGDKHDGISLPTVSSFRPGHIVINVMKYGTNKV